MSASDQPSGRPRAVLAAIGWMLAGVVLTLGFLAYQQPDLLFNAVNLRYCG